MPETVAVELLPNRIEVEPGSKPVDASVGLRNLSGVVSQYTIEIADLESDWYTVPVPSVGLFPQDHEQVRISFHPPKRPDLRAGAYPFRILVRGRGGVQEQSTEGVLDVRGFAVYRLDLTPRRLVDHDEGDFKLVVTNSGTADVTLELEARDDEDQTTLIFPKGDVWKVEAGSKATIPFTVRPRVRPWIGPDRSYTVQLTARPQEARGLPQTISAQYTHRPYLASWDPVMSFLRIAGIIAVVLIILWFLFVSPFGGEFTRRLRVFVSPACTAFIGNVPVIGRVVCSSVVGATMRAGNPTPPGTSTAASGTTGAPGAAAPSVAGQPSSGPVGGGAASSGGPCEFALGFRAFADAFPGIVGRCTAAEAHDGFGNGYQNTTNGVLVWQKGTNQIFFMAENRTYTFVNGAAQVVS
ncbi:MAG TPA: hypothetical protein VFN74_06550 [Chloroflexota bacterium]|nr:hypothetical protein [Chloroflexota bacterium]